MSKNFAARYAPPPAVPLRKWLLVFTKRDSPKAMDFLNMKKVACSNVYDH